MRAKIVEIKDADVKQRERNEEIQIQIEEKIWQYAA